MSDEQIQQAGIALSGGDFSAAMDIFDAMRTEEPDNAVGHYGWAEAAFMRISIDMEEEPPAALIMRAYKKSLELDEENLEYVSSFANFCLDCGRIPMAIKEYQRLEKMAELNEIPVEDTLFEASRLIVEAIERIDPERKNPMASPWIKQALIWAVGGLGFDAEAAVETLTSD